MEAIRKQASKFREQVARQQQVRDTPPLGWIYSSASRPRVHIRFPATYSIGGSPYRRRVDRLLTPCSCSQAVLKQFGGGYGADGVFADEAEAQQHSKLEKLYISTRAAKHFQRDIVRGVEGYIVTGSKQVEIGNKLCEDGKKYGTENTCTSGSTLSKAALSFAKARSLMEKERGNLLKALGTQVAEPLRAMVMGAPLEDARHLAQRYDRMRQEAEAQAIEVSKRQMKLREASGNSDMISRLEASESKLQELKSNMGVLGKEAVAAMTAVEAQQQRLTLQRLIALVESERNYHQRVLQVLDQLEREMVSERQRIEGVPPPAVETSMPPPPAYEEVNGIFMRNSTVAELVETVEYFLAEVSKNGWAEGECRGKAGWFPSDYIEKRERVLASKVAQVF
ncbi:hypothetical protein PR202_ga07569 [Eleusine coracana subsp. coracana]|uniref:SH3 domain-containing protein n=1 Tax=Eleusine coracana subsp. coracana TaxID=191504 RepID=A0AAV5BXV9_ELECO|nr:hypothetical protein PR202_ga07569 [Eleusine coracana subsp. coracana]